MEDFLDGENLEAKERVRAFAQGREKGILTLWGPQPSGKTHLLRGAVALAQKAGKNALYLGAGKNGLPQEQDTLFLALDDIEILTPQDEKSLFLALEEARKGWALLLASRIPPACLPWAPEITSRLSQGLVFRLRAPSEVSKRRILAARAQALGLCLPEGFLDYCLKHTKRDLASLVLLVEKVAEMSLEKGRAPTLALAREVMEEE